MPGDSLAMRLDSKQRKMRGTTALPLVPKSIAARAAVKSVSLGLECLPRTCWARANTPAKPRQPAAQACHCAPWWLTRSVYSPLEPAKSTKPPELSTIVTRTSIELCYLDGWSSPRLPALRLKSFGCSRAQIYLYSSKICEAIKYTCLTDPALLGSAQWQWWRMSQAAVAMLLVPQQ